MPILFSVVARGTTVLAKHANCAGNFLEVIEQVLAKISRETSKMTYSHGRYTCTFTHLLSLFIISRPAPRGQGRQNPRSRFLALFSMFFINF